MEEKKVAERRKERSQIDTDPLYLRSGSTKATQHRRDGWREWAHAGNIGFWLWAAKYALYHTWTVVCGRREMRLCELPPGYWRAASSFIEQHSRFYCSLCELPPARPACILYFMLSRNYFTSSPARLFSRSARRGYRCSAAVLMAILPARVCSSFPFRVR